MDSLNKKPLPRFVSKKDFFDITDCECGKKVFKYYDTTKNQHVLKCCNYKDPKKSKSGPCGMFYMYCDIRPVFEEIKNKIIKKSEILKDPSKILEEKLRILFKFLYVSNHTATLDEINILVKNSLKREPRKVYYFPTTAAFNRISHYETFKEYEERIFSKKIVDLNFEIKKEQEQPVWFIDKSLLPKIKIHEPVVKRKIIKKVNPVKNNFIIVPEDNSDSDLELESDHSDLESEYELEEEEIVEEKEINEEEDIVVDDEICDYDDNDPGDNYDYDD